jgi:hypothetical protein
MTSGVLSVDNCCFGRAFSQCVIAADAAYLEAMWPAMDDYHDALSGIWDTYVSCVDACPGDDDSCKAACSNATWDSGMLAYAAIYAEEFTQAAVRNSSRGTCVRDLSYDLGLGCIPDGQLKTRDMNAEVFRFRALQKLWEKMNSLGCTQNELGGTYAPYTSCRAAANVESVFWWDTSRVDLRLSDCIEFWDRNGKAVHHHNRGRCQAKCAHWEASYDALCTTAMDSCVNSCCGGTSAEQELCLSDCASFAACGSGGCESALTSCLQACGPDDTQACIEACATDWDDCIGADFDGGLPYAFDESDPEACFGICQIELFPDCPDCGTVARRNDNDFLCLPESFGFRGPPQIGGASCD